MIDVFSRERVCPEQPEIIKDFDFYSAVCCLTPRCAVWLRSAMHTAEIDSSVRCTPQSFVSLNLEYLTLQYGAHCGDWLSSVMYAAEIDSTMGRVGNLLIGFLSESLVFCAKNERFAQKNEQFNHSLIFGAISSFIMSDLSESLTVAHFSWGTWAIRSQSLICPDGMHSAKFLKNSNIFAESKKNLKIL